MNWVFYALLSAVAAGATAVLAKVGVANVSSNVATAIRVCVILLFAWAIVLSRGEAAQLKHVSARSALFLALSGVATGISWLAYFRALQLAPASRVAPIDKLSLAVAVLLAGIFLNEPITWRLGLGVALMVLGAALTI